MDSPVININRKINYDEFARITPAALKHPDIQQIDDLIRNRSVGDDRLFVMEGLWAYEKIVAGRLAIRTFAFCPEFIRSARDREMVRELASLARNVYTVSSKVCSRLSDRDGTEGFFLVCLFPRYKLDDLCLRRDNLLVILDGLEQPGNIGTIIRSVDGAGGDAVIVCNRKVRLTHSRLVKASMGSCFLMPVLEADMGELIAWLRKNSFTIVLTDLSAEDSYFNTDYSGRVAIVAGNEINGISEVWRTLECKRVIIPMLGGADSLNVGFATTMVAYEASLQQKGYLQRGS